MVDICRRFCSSGFRLCVLVLIVVGSVSGIGCNKQASMQDVYDTNLKKLHVCYTMFMEDHGYQGPKDESELKEYLKTNPTAVTLIKRIDLTPENVDEIFIGQRDDEPFEVRYGLRGTADHAIVFERTGVDGKRLVAFANPVELEEDEYLSYLNGDQKPESAPEFGAEVTGESEQ